jgi:pimeloyl-ACP methyl ester carboxylesterase
MMIKNNSNLNARVILMTTIFGFILLVGSLFVVMNNNSKIILPQASAQNQSRGVQMGAPNSSTSSNMATKHTNIVLVHGLWADGSSWSKVIPILQKAGHKVIAVQLALHSLEDDVATVKRAIALVGGPTILVAHSYGGFVITNAANNNKNVTGLVYVAAFAPEQGKTLSDYVPVTKIPKGLLVTDSGGFIYLNSTQFPQAFAQDVNLTEAKIMAATQKPVNQSIINEKSGPPAWKQLPSWYQISQNDRIIPPDVEHMFSKQINATTISLSSSHASLVSHPNEIAQLILNATKESKR